jgi:DNA repair exonuclease SbcCD ATPase subunit
MHSLPLYDEEVLQQKQGQINELHQTVTKLTQTLKDKQAEEKSLQDLKTLFLDVQLKTTRLSELTKKENNINALDQQVKEFEKCEQVFKNPFENRNKLQENIISQQSEAKKFLSKKATLEATVKTEADKVDSLREAYSNREVLLKKATELEKIVLIKSLQATITTLSLRIEKGGVEVKKEENNLEVVKQQLADLKAAIASTEQSLPDTALLVSISNWFNDKKQSEISISKSSNELSELLDKVQKVKADFTHCRMKYNPGLSQTLYQL